MTIYLEQIPHIAKGREKMKKIMRSGIIAAVLLLCASTSVMAQDAGNIEDEFAVFRKKKAEFDAKQAGKQQPAADPLAAAAAAADAQQAANPLGPAGNLPVDGGLPPDGLALGAQQTPEEVAAQMEAEMEEQKIKMKEEAFQGALEVLMPLSPQEIRTTLEKFKESRQAAETPITVPTPKSRVETVSLDPGADPHIIRLSPGYVTTLSILDQTGMPWAIQDLNWAGKVEIDRPAKGSHIVRLVPEAAHGSGNVSIRLVDLITPITFRFDIGIEEVDYRFDARIPKQGPLAKTPLIEYGGLKTVAGTDEHLSAILDGTASGEVKKLKIDGTDGRTTAWRVEDKMYLRTPLTMLSPAWNESATSADGTNVYTLAETPVVLLSDGGKMVKIRVIPDESEF